MESTYNPTDQEMQEAQDYFEATKSLVTVAEKKDVFKLAIKEQILNGYLNPLEFYRQAKIAAECIEELKKDPDVFDCAMEEINKYGKEKPNVKGAIVSASHRSNYNYESTGDPIWKELKQKLQEREKFLKAIPSAGTVDPDTGVLIMPPTVTETQFITVKI